MLLGLLPLTVVPTAAFAPAQAFLRPGKNGLGKIGQHRAPGLAFAAPARGFKGAAMGLLDGLKKTLGGELPTRGYDDLKPGTFAHEAAQYALKGEIKEKSASGHDIATFGGGCFWGVELAFQRVPGVIETCVGYSQGELKHPMYELVCTGMTGHTEIVQLTYDPKVTNMKVLTRLLFSRIDPSLKDQVGNDRGTQYRHGVYYHTEAQKKEAEEVFKEIEAAGGGPIYTELEPVGVMYPAEEYHQQYLERGGRMGMGQSAAKGCTDPIRCYG